MSEESLHAEVRLDAQGRVVIPAELRRALGFKPGDELIMYIEDCALVVDTADNLVRRAQDEFIRTAGHIDPVDLLLEERRAEANRFDAEHPLAAAESDTHRATRPG
jgi:AbrB family looped-hinge helix DNA binding protein